MSEANTVPGSARTAEPAEDPEAVLERLSDPTYLPSYAELSRLGEHAEEGFRRLIGDPLVHGFTYGYRRFEIFTQEYIAGLTDLILAERDRQGISGGFGVLETGAGDGNLSYFLKQELARRQEGGVFVICTDSGDLGIEPIVPDHLEFIEAGQAVHIFNPNLVVQSWMSGRLDLTSAFRSNESVGSYVLIGEADTSFSGMKWETWGLGERPSKPAPYRKDGFDKERVEIAPQLNWNSLDTHEIPSSTHVFRRQSRPA